MCIYYHYIIEGIGDFLLFGSKIVYPDWETPLFDIERAIFVRKIVAFGKTEKELDAFAFKKLWEGWGK